MYLAIDVGGTKTLLAVFTDKGELKEQIKFPTPKDYGDFLGEVASNVDKLSTKEFSYGAIGMPGAVNRKEGLSVNAGPNISWTDTHICRDIEKLVRCPFVLENDAKAAALSEATLLKGAYRKVLYVTVSTGIGGGYVIDGKIDSDFEDMEPGHMLLEHNNKLQRWEEFASGKAVFNKYGIKFSDIKDPQIWYAIARNIALGLTSLIVTLTPEVIVIGGGAGGHLDKFKDRLDEQLKIYENPLVHLPPIVAAQNPEQAVIYGCYRLAKEHYGRHR